MTTPSAISSPTPRTDAAICTFGGLGDPSMEKVYAAAVDFARQLERELAEAEAELERRQAKIMRLTSPSSSIEAPETPGTWEQRCSALYQVIGCIAHAAGLFDTQDACDALDVAAGRGDVEGLLPWPKDAKLLHDLEAKLANPSTGRAPLTGLNIFGALNFGKHTGVVEYGGSRSSVSGSFDFDTVAEYLNGKSSAITPSKGG